MVSSNSSPGWNIGGGLRHIPEERAPLLEQYVGCALGVCQAQEMACSGPSKDGDWTYRILAVGHQSSNRPAMALCVSERPFLGRC